MMKNLSVHETLAEAIEDLTFVLFKIESETPSNHLLIQLFYHIFEILYLFCYDNIAHKMLLLAKFEVFQTCLKAFEMGQSKMIKEIIYKNQEFIRKKGSAFLPVIWETISTGHNSNSLECLEVYVHEIFKTPFFVP